jgi:peroxiredoxin
MALTPSTMAPLGSPAPDFVLPDPHGTIWRRDDFANAKVLLVAFLSNHCPYVQHIRHEFARFAKEAQAEGAAVVGIMSNDFEKYPDDRPDKMREAIDAVGYTFPYLIDESQAVAKAYTAACTPDFFLYDSNRRLAYRGQFDASRPDSGIPVTGTDLRAALHAVLAGTAVDPNQRPSMGCNVKWRPGNAPPYFA